MFLPLHVKRGAWHTMLITNTHGIELESLWLSSMTAGLASLDLDVVPGRAVPGAVKQEGGEGRWEKC